MRPFIFKLDPLLNLRRREEREKQIVLAEANRQRVRLEQTLRQQQENLSVGKVSLRDTLVGRLDVASLRFHAANSTQVHRAARRIVLELAGVHRRIEAAREQLVEAARRRRALELLLQKRMAQWKQAASKAEEAHMDELAVMAGVPKSE